MDKLVVSQLFAQFEGIVVQVDDKEYWHARELMRVLGYDKWANFLGVIEKAKTACSQSNQSVEDHFADAGKMVGLGSEARREIEDLRLTRYACYLIAQNADSRKPPVAFAQTYFAIQTRKQELNEPVIQKFLEQTNEIPAYAGMTK